MEKDEEKSNDTSNHYGSVRLPEQKMLLLSEVKNQLLINIIGKA